MKTRKGVDFVNSGRACKNLTDGLVLAVAFLALMGLVLEFLAFDGEYMTNHPTTSEEITVKSPLDHPYADSYLKLFAAFLITAVLGFGARKTPLVGVFASLCSIVVSLNLFSGDLIESFPFVYVLVSVTGLAGSIIYACLHYTENPQKVKNKKGEKKK